MDRNSKFFWIWLPAIAGVVFALFIRMHLVTYEFSTPQGASTLQPDKIEQLNDDSISIANYLLIDSILSIVQSYYVDADRISPDKILDATIEDVNERSRYKVALNSERTSLSLEDGQAKVDLAVSDPLDYSTLVELLARVARFFDESNDVHFRGDATLSEVSQGAMDVLNYMLESLDAHSALLDQQIYKELRQGTEGSFGGLGILVGSHDNSLTIIKPIAGSPAEQAQLKRHDKIINIDGVDTYGQSLDSLVEYMRGEPGTDVNLSVLRSGFYAPLDVKLKRKIINVNSVESSLHKLDGDGYLLNLKIDSFSSRTTKEILQSINSTVYKIGTKLQGISLDLRSNPGGLLDQAIEVADLFLDDGVIVSTRGRRTEIENAGKNYARLDLPIFLLIDKESASASEIVAGALQDHDRALVIGQPSFGKGSVQTVFELPGERALKLTIARYYTPSGRAIQNIGIYPDVWLQPVLQRSLNTNLFGKSRYRSERFLSHRLENRSVERSILPATPFRTYYLKDEKTEDAFSDFEPLDYEIEVAKIILNKVVDHYTTPLEEGFNRASHWLVLASKELGAFVQEHNGKVQDWLKKRFDIDWGVASERKVEPLLSFRLMKQHIQGFRGAVLQIPWKLTNAGTSDNQQVSIFLRSDNYGIPTKEVIIGKIGAKETKFGNFKVRIPNDLADSRIRFSVGVAVGAAPLSKVAWHFNASVADKDRPNLVFDYDLIEEELHPNGILDPGESAKIKIYLKNNGQAATLPGRLHLKNLAGRQIHIETPVIKITEVKPGDEVTRVVKVRASKDIVSENIKLGMMVKSGNLIQPIKQTLSVRSQKNKNLADIDLLAH